MDTMQKIVLIAHTFIAIMIIVLVLLQRGKGADAGAAFGSGASGTVFGARGSSNFFSRATAVLATVFFASSLTLAYMSSQRAESPSSLIERAPVVETPEDRGRSTPGSGADTEPQLPALDDDADRDPDTSDLPALEPGDDEPEKRDSDENR
jgi:preprotein translocase subunit SecG